MEDFLNPSNEEYPTGDTVTDDGWIMSEKIRRKLEEKHDVSPEEFDEIIRNAQETQEQEDGATAHVEKVKTGRKVNYNVAVVNKSSRRAVTAMKGLTRREVQNLGRNYGYR